MVQSQPMMRAAPVMQQSVAYSVPSSTQTVAQPVFGSMPVLQSVPVMQRPEMVQFGSMPVLPQYPGSIQQYPGVLTTSQQYPGFPEEQRLIQDPSLRSDSPSRVIQ
mmetsp:Transcript_48439/g.105455  ORF Transcript_48439/g.105455 Transcript_48439/m.105455 type:complete len:106 (-) Transcript_48439:70-387(-)